MLQIVVSSTLNILVTSYYGLMGKSCNETRLARVQNSCRLNRRSSSWAPLEQEALLLHKLSSLLLVVEWHLSAKLHDSPMRL